MNNIDLLQPLISWFSENDQEFKTLFTLNPGTPYEISPFKLFKSVYKNVALNSPYDDENIAKFSLIYNENKYIFKQVANKLDMANQLLLKESYQQKISRESGEQRNDTNTTTNTIKHETQAHNKNSDISSDNNSNLTNINPENLSSLENANQQAISFGVNDLNEKTLNELQSSNVLNVNGNVVEVSSNTANALRQILTLDLLNFRLEFIHKFKGLFNFRLTTDSDITHSNELEKYFQYILELLNGRIVPEMEKEAQKIVDKGLLELSDKVTNSKLDLSLYTVQLKKDLDNYIQVNHDKLKGERGERGEQGLQGVPGERGPQGEPGKDGEGSLWEISARNNLVPKEIPNFQGLYIKNDTASTNKPESAIVSANSVAVRTYNKTTKEMVNSTLQFNQLYAGVYNFNTNRDDRIYQINGNGALWGEGYKDKYFSLQHFNDYLELNISNSKMIPKKMVSLIKFKIRKDKTNFELDPQCLLYQIINEMIDAKLPKPKKESSPDASPWDGGGEFADSDIYN